MKVKKNLFIETVNRGQINKDQVDVFVKCLKLVLVYRIFYKNKPWTTRNKGFRTYAYSKALNFKALKVELLANYK